MKPLKNKGFSLVEIIVVLVIVGLLAAILIPSLGGYVGDAQLSACQINRRTMLDSYHAYIKQSIYDEMSTGSDTFESWLEYEGQILNLQCPGGGDYSYVLDSRTGEEHITCSRHGEALYSYSAGGAIEDARSNAYNFAMAIGSCTADFFEAHEGEAGLPSTGSFIYSMSDLGNIDTQPPNTSNWWRGVYWEYILGRMGITFDSAEERAAFVGSFADMKVFFAADDAGRPTDEVLAVYFKTGDGKQSTYFPSTGGYADTHYSNYISGGQLKPGVELPAA